MSATTKRAANWSPEEDEQLARSWVHVSEDPIRANSMKCEEFWSRACEDFNKYAPSGARETKSLMNRWQHLQKATLKFTAIYSKIQSNPPSGSAPSDWLKQAKQLYHNETGRHFAYERAWEVLKDVAKWETMACPKPAVPRRLTSEVPSSSTSEAHPSDSVDPQSDTNVRSETRPTGHKSAKRAMQNDEFMRRKLKLMEQSQKQAAVRVAEYQRSNQLQDRLVEIEVRKAEAELRAQSLEFMQKDVSKCPDKYAQEFILREKRKILEEMEEQEKNQKRATGDTPALPSSEPVSQSSPPPSPEDNPTEQWIGDHIEWPDSDESDVEEEQEETSDQAYQDLEPTQTQTIPLDPALNF